MALHLVSFNYDGDRYSHEIEAESPEEAMDICRALAFAQYDGEIGFSFPADFRTFLSDLATWQTVIGVLIGGAVVWSAVFWI